MLLLDHVGAKTGARRTSPLLCVRDGDDVVIVASKGGHPKHPAWFHNPRANPDTTVQIGAAEVRFVVVGGLADNAWGYVRATRDLDMVPAPDADNLDRLAAVPIGKAPS
jgi:deazaflavin-dependent oxidoreductase (nitroreductase family)